MKKNFSQKLDEVSKGFIEVINNLDESPCTVDYTDFDPEKTLSLMLTVVPGTPRVNEDICGGYEAEINFALYLRTVPETNDDRIEAVAVLSSIAEQLEQEENFPTIDNVEFWEVEKTSTPTLIARENDSVRIYQVQFTARFEIKQ